MTTVVGYLRCSTREQADSALGLRAQRSAIQAEADRRGWQIVWKVDEGSTGKHLRRDGIAEAFELLRTGAASALVVAKLDRLSRSVIDFSNVIEAARVEGWNLVALDLGVDLSTPAGEMLATVLASFAQYERRLISTRTKDALAELKLEGVRLGREALVSPEALDLIRTLASTRRPASIARALDAAALQTPNGAKRWYGSTVSRILARETA